MENTKMKKSGSRYNSPADKKRKIEKAEYFLFVMGLTQMETASLIGISQNAMTKWVQALGWDDKLNKLQRVEHCKELKFKDSLSGFMAYLQKKHPRKYKNMYSVYNIFINTH